MERIKPLALSGLSGLLLLFAFPPFEFAPALFVALVPWMASIQSASGKEAWNRGYIFGLVFALGRLHFLEALAAQWTGSIGLALVPWLLASLAMAVYFGLLSVLARGCFARRVPWLIPIVWAGVEVFRSYLPVLAFPWALLATPLWRYPALIQEARLGTIFLVSAWIVLVNLGIGYALSRRSRAASWALGISALCLLLSLAMYRLGPDTTPVKVEIGQTGVNMAFGDPATQDLRSSRAIEQLESIGLKSGCWLLVLPEGSARIRSMGSQIPFRVDPKIPLLFGAQTGAGPVYQSAVGYDGRFQSVDKTRLVIFGEFVPGRDYLPFLSAFHLPTGDLTAGEHGTQAMTIGGLGVGPMICFEGVFPDIAWKQSLNGARVIAVISIDDWFMASSAPDELRAGAVWRAIETGLPAVRAASLGYSFAVDGHGKILAEAPVGAMDGLPVDLPVPDHPIIGYWEPVFPASSLIAMLALPWLGRRFILAKADPRRATEGPGRSWP